MIIHLLFITQSDKQQLVSQWSDFMSVEWNIEENISSEDFWTK